MSTDTEVRIRGLRALVDALGTVEAERFITLILREPFDLYGLAETSLGREECC
jgi:hypothetical protein